LGVLAERLVEDPDEFNIVGLLAQIGIVGDEHSPTPTLAIEDHLQARVCWTLGCFNSVAFEGKFLRTIIRHLKGCVIGSNRHARKVNNIFFNIKTF